MRVFIKPLPMADGSPRVVVLADGSRLADEGTVVEMKTFVQRLINEGAVEMVEENKSKKSKAEDKQ